MTSSKLGSIPAQSGGARIDLSMRIARFQLPPVQSALVVGKRASIGSHAITKALEEMMPRAFERHPVEHPVIEAIVVRSAHLRRLAPDRLLPIIVRHAETLMSEDDMLHFDIEVEVRVTDRVEL